MKIRPDILTAAENRLPPGLARPELSAGDLQAESFALIGPAEDASLAKRVANLAFAGARPSTTELERLIGSNDLVDEFYLKRAIIAARPVMRITLRDEAGRERGWATGFMVSPRLLLTNWHVFPTQEETANAISEANYVLDIAGNPAPSYRFVIRGDLFYLSDAQLDFALVAVDPVAQDGRTGLVQFGFHRLVPQPNKIREGECMTIIQHPGGERRQFSIRENRLCRILDQFIWYQSDTAPGSSGAPAFNDSFQVVALHHSGAARRDEQGLYVLRDGSTVASLEGVDDSQIDWVANEGLRISLLCSFLQSQMPPGSTFTQELFQAMQGGDVMTGALQENGQTAALPITEPIRAPVVAVGNNLSIPLQLQISLTMDGLVAGIAPRPVEKSPDQAGPTPSIVGEEGLRYPIIDRDYTNRKGYQLDFLGFSVPLPKVTRRSLVARTSDGKFAIPYEHFTVVIHKKRRLALFTASNLDYSKARRQPEPGDYTRNGLGGFGKSGSEKWLTDPRLPQQDQLPDVFYTKDGGSFDKGHVVRREDVCWGTSYAQVVRANGDTFHVTNCTPQVSGFNQSARGVENWGDLENEIQKQAKTEQLSVLSGPILLKDDPYFEGEDGIGPVRIQIPRKFWKVVLANENGQLAAYAFILQQDLRGLPEEFTVLATWKPYLVSIPALQAQLSGFTFPPEIRLADRFGQNGLEIARVVGAEIHPNLANEAKISGGE